MECGSRDSRHLQMGRQHSGKRLAVLENRLHRRDVRVAAEPG